MQQTNLHLLPPLTAAVTGEVGREGDGGGAGKGGEAEEKKGGERREGKLFRSESASKLGRNAERTQARAGVRGLSATSWGQAPRDRFPGASAVSFGVTPGVRR